MVLSYYLLYTDPTFTTRMTGQVAEMSREIQETYLTHETVCAFPKIKHPSLLSPKASITPLPIIETTINTPYLSKQYSLTVEADPNMKQKVGPFLCNFNVSQSLEGRPAKECPCGINGCGFPVIHICLVDESTGGDSLYPGL